MKNIKYINRWLTLVIPIVILAGCSKDFLVKPPESAITNANFFQTDAQVMDGTALLYSYTWFDYNDKASYDIGEVLGGTFQYQYNDQSYALFSPQSTDINSYAAWQAFFETVGQANTAIQNITTYAGPAVTPAIKKYAIAECRFMRSLAYRYLVMNWGPVPIITDNQAILTSASLRPNTTQSVWRFVINEMLAAVKDLPATPYETGRLTKWSAEGMLARYYLTYAGVQGSGGARNSTFLDSAMYYANDVIQNSGKSLVTNYYDLFKYNYNNNPESLFELQWVYSPNTWGLGNSYPSYITFESSIANGDGWGGNIGATFWVLSKYHGLALSAGGDTLMGRSTDMRLPATFFMPGVAYPEILNLVNGANIPLVDPTNSAITAANASYTNAIINVKKYVCGNNASGIPSSSQHYPQHTYMQRLAELYLIYAEAKLGNNTSTTDPTALAYFNAIHSRGYYPNGPDSTYTTLNFMDIFNERVVEFAGESMCWYDLVNLHYYNPQLAYNIINSQWRGAYGAYPDQNPNPTNWTIIKTSWWTSPTYATASSANFGLQIPAVEQAAAPNLLLPAVDYYGSK